MAEEKSTIDEQIEFAWKVYQSSKEFNSQFDFKYSPILTTNLAGIALLGASLKDRESTLAQNPSLWIFTGLSFFAFFVSILYLVVSNSPSYTFKDVFLKITGEPNKDEIPRSNIFFHDIQRAPSADEFMKKIKNNWTKEEVLRDLTDQIYEISKIAARKGDRIRFATTALLIGLCSTFVDFAILLLTQKK